MVPEAAGAAEARVEVVALLKLEVPLVSTVLVVAVARRETKAHLVIYLVTLATPIRSDVVKAAEAAGVQQAPTPEV